MQSIKRLLNITIVISCFLLAASYFLPTEALWSPSDAWTGYYIASGQFVTGLNVGLIEVFPYAVGPIVLLILALSRWPKVGIVVAVVSFVAGVVSLVIWGMDGITGTLLYKFPKLWLILEAVLIPLVAVIMIIALWKFRQKTDVLTLAAILDAESILSLIVSY